MRHIAHYRQFIERLKGHGFQKDPSQQRSIEGHEGRYVLYLLDLNSILELRLWVNETAESVCEDSKWNFESLAKCLKRYQQLDRRMNAMIRKKTTPFSEAQSDEYFDFLEKHFDPLANHLHHTVHEESAEKRVSPLAFALPALTIPGLQHAKKNEFKLLNKLMSILNEAYGDFEQERRGRPKGSYDLKTRQITMRLLREETISDRRLRLHSKMDERMRRVAKIRGKSFHTIKKHAYQKRNKIVS